LPKARDFLNDKATSSTSTKNTYAIALAHLQTFLKNSQDYKDYDVQTILEPLKDKTIDVYTLFRNFRDYLGNRQDEYFGGKNLSPKSVILYIAAVRPYFEAEDVDISDRRFKNKVTLPKKYRTEPEAIDDTDIRNMLNTCSNKRLKAFIFLLATTGLRANEALLLRNSDVFFDESPVRIHIRPENIKTKQGRDMYTTDEAAKYLKIFIDSKHDNKPDHILFKLQDNDEEHKGKLYARISTHFKRLLEEIGLDKRKDGDSR
jgi:integrase